MEILKYKEFEGSAELDMKRNVCRGKILYIDDAVTYESKSIGDLQKQFEEAVDDYIETCKQIGKEPQKSCRGQFNVRVSPELHRAATRRSIADNTSLNDVVCKALGAYLGSATSPVSVTAHGVETHRASILQTVLVSKIDPAAFSRRLDSTATTVRLTQSQPRAGVTEPKEYWEAIGSSVAETLPTTPEHIYAH
ncbi:type II toxin-antitoxin system HicB family antitoxin [Polaromonas sp.]|uniref:type II toxin-antitoxin system HicB family antitoxin n=1 Tax=Polaromonas sp. TaxID=1869339 RepID=UPI002FC86608